MHTDFFHVFSMPRLWTCANEIENVRGYWLFFPFSCHEARTVVPSPGVEIMVKVPPRSSVLSRIVVRPRLSGQAVLAAFKSNPTPRR